MDPHGNVQGSRIRRHPGAHGMNEVSGDAVRAPTSVGCSVVACSTVPSWIDVRAPVRISPWSPRGTACGQTLTSVPSSTGPMTVAPG
ncbi:MAG: hypothetical protein JWP33_434 [Blastococcus sp.]|nr:hypothetical protein [Blastococcus sp.]